MRRSYRELIAWQRAMDLVVATYRLTKLLPAEERFGLTSQMRRAAVSIPSNIAEGHGRGLKNAFAHHLAIAIGSLRELETQTHLTLRLGQVQPQQAEPVLALAEETGRTMAGLIRAVRQYKQS